MGDEALDVQTASLPSRKLIQINVQLRLKIAETDGAASDSAPDIRQTVVDIGEGKMMPTPSR